jgi:hypothetical protein
MCEQAIGKLIPGQSAPDLILSQARQLGLQRFPCSSSLITPNTRSDIVAMCIGRSKVTTLMVIGLLRMDPPFPNMQKQDIPSGLHCQF